MRAREFELNISEFAMQIISDSIAISGIKNPVIGLIQLSEVQPKNIVFDNMNLDESEKRKICEAVSKGKSKLIPGVFRPSQFLWLFLVKINGTTFFINPSLRRQVKGGRLEVNEKGDGLVLYDKFDQIILPLA